jgi:hypothetical protein
VEDRNACRSVKHGHVLTNRQRSDDNHHASSTSPPYSAGSSLASTSGRSSFPIVPGPWPTTFILASVAGGNMGLNIQKIHVMIVGTFTKNFFACHAQSGLLGEQGNDARQTHKELGIVVLEYGRYLRSGRFRVCSATAETDTFVVYVIKVSQWHAHATTAAYRALEPFGRRFQNLLV